MTGVLLLAASAAVVCNLTYALGMYLESALAPRRLAPSPDADGLFFVFLVPCLNEERVLAATLDELSALPLGDFLVLVVDDGSTDATFRIADRHPDPRVRVLRRRLPDARQGKGAALNAAVRQLTQGALADHPPDRVVVGLLDADGRLDPDTFEAVAPWFADPQVGAVQVGVRIRNRGDGLLTRLQDMEFVTYTRVFQVAHNRLGIAGLGGNGQFTRLQALLDLGEAPWSDSLTEDLDLGVRMQLAGWWTMHAASVSVQQQGLPGLRRLTRQRSRWFQGNLQAWRLVPRVVRHARGRAAAETFHVLLMPVLVLLSSFMALSFASALLGLTLSPLARAQLLHWPVAVSWYLLTFVPGILFGYVYRRSGDPVGHVRAVLLGHAFILYGLLWMAAGWWAVGRSLRRRRSWFKTERVADEPNVVASPGEARVLTSSPSHRHRA